MNVSVTIEGMEKLTALMAALGPSNRRRLNAVGAKALENRVRRHILSYAPSKHATADALGAQRTRHYENALGAISSSATAEGGEVTVPIAGISRAYHEITLTTPTGTGKKYLTIAKHIASYGKTVAELRALGWTVFRPGKKKVLLGYRHKGDKPEVLYALAESVRQRQDPSLMPTNDECTATVVEAITDEVNRRIREAR